MSPEMLTLVATVLTEDMAREMCEVRSSILEAEDEMSGRRVASASRRAKSCIRLEKDMVTRCALSGPERPDSSTSRGCEGERGRCWAGKE